MYHTYGTGTWILDCCHVPTPFIGWGDILRSRLGQSWAASATWIYLYPRGGPWIGQHDILSTILVFLVTRDLYYSNTIEDGHADSTKSSSTELLTR